MSFLRIKPSYLFAVLFLMAVIIVPPLRSQRVAQMKTDDNQNNSHCSWKNPSTETCPDSNWVVKKDSRGCPYLYCPQKRKVLGEKDEPKLIRITVEKETFVPGETVLVQMKNISGRRINLPEQISWEIKKITGKKELLVFSQKTPTLHLASFERNQVFKFYWDQKDRWGKTASPANYQFITEIEDQTFTLNFTITNLK